jgi:hypothetical protein
MKALMSFVLLVCLAVSMSSFTSVKPPVRKKVTKSVKTVNWPITGTHAGWNYTITGSSSTQPAYVNFNNGVNYYGPFTFDSQSGGMWYASIPTTSPVYASIHAVKIGIYTNQEGYVLEWVPDF